MQIVAKKTGKGQRKATTVTVTDSGLPIPVGDRFTIEGCGLGAKGQEVIDDFNPKTKRKCKCVRLRTYVFTGVIGGGE